MFSKASIFLFFATTQFLFRSISCVEFVYNSNFTTTNTLLIGTTVTSSPSILTLTIQTPNSIGRALYPSRISAASSGSPLPFATSFIFSMVPYKNMFSVYGFSFVILPSSESAVAYSAQLLGVEFDVCCYQLDNLVGIVVNSTSVSPAVAGFYGGGHCERFTELRLNSGENYQAWIEFNGSAINVTLALGNP